MEKRILIAPNSFKECADSVTIAELIRENLSQLTYYDLIVKPISDGGDGFLNVCKQNFGGEIRFYSISTAYDENKFSCPVLYCQSRNEIYIESAEILGLKVVPIQLRNPLELSSKGLGELLLRINEEVSNEAIKIDRVYVGIGGTATIDMGIGMMSKLGLKLLDQGTNELNVLPKNYFKVADIIFVPIQFSFEIVPVIDVNNPLLGEYNGIETYGLQKGANENSIILLMNYFNHLINLLENKKLSISSQSLSGAGGGIPASLQIFYNTPLYSSQDFILQDIGLKSLTDEVDYLITGEGSFNHQSSFGKGAGILIDLFKSSVKKIFLVCGYIDSSVKSKLPDNVIPIELNKYFNSETESIMNYKDGIRRACDEIINQVDF